MSPPIVWAGGLNINGFEPPMILIKDWLPDEVEVKYTRYPVTYELNFYLSDSGCIDSLKYYSDDELKYIDGVLDLLNNIDFSPGLYMGKEIPTILPARLEFVTKRYRPTAILKLPYDSQMDTNDGELVEKILELNKFSPASVKKVPPYFCRFKKVSNRNSYQYAIYKIELDPFGQANQIETIFTNYQHYSDMFFTVLLYSEFQPARYEGKAVSSNLFVTVRFFQKLPYPSEIWPPLNETDLDLSYDYHRISFRPYLDSIVNPPMPINLIKGGINQERNIVFIDTIQVSVTIDTLGNIKRHEYKSRQYPIGEKITKAVLKKLKYHPARDISGSKSIFEGELTVIFNLNSRNIRIVSNWLLK